MRRGLSSSPGHVTVATGSFFNALARQTPFSYLDAAHTGRAAAKELTHRRRFTGGEPFVTSDVVSRPCSHTHTYTGVTGNQ